MHSGNKPQNVIKRIEAMAGSHNIRKRLRLMKLSSYILSPCMWYMAGAALHWCFSSFRKFPKLQIAGCEEKCNTMVCTSTQLYSRRAGGGRAAVRDAAPHTGPAWQIL